MRSVKNVQAVMTRRSYPDFMVAMRNKVDIKEWSEVGGVFGVTRVIMHYFNPDVIYDIGCGKRPTLATMMSLNYTKPVIAIDPQLDVTYADNLNGLVKIQSTVSEELESLSTDYDYGSALILANHSHCTRAEIARLSNIYKSWVYVTVPCCVENTLHAASLMKEDNHMHSPKNKIYIQSSSRSLLSEIITRL